ncbi:hydrolase TatD [Clostridia bacterium]|nr:hydrolase TatD [Clostridia bacterium]
MSLIFDAHAHYDDEAFNSDRETLLQNMQQNGVGKIVNAAVDIKTSEFGIEYSHKYDFMYTTIGIHPECANKVEPDYLAKIESLLQDSKAVAIGEIGLDYHWQDVPKETQQKVFEDQLKLAVKLDIPVVIHDREAHADVLAMLKKYKPKGLVHCFSGSVEICREIVKLGMSISLGGVVTFKNARHSVEVAADIPIDKLLLETDAPYLSPVPFRGKRCDSSMIKYTAEKIAEIRNITTQQVIDITCANAEKLYLY